MDRKGIGLIFIFLSAAMWLQSFTYIALNTAFLNIQSTKSVMESFLNSGQAGSLLTAVMCAALGLMFIKIDSLDEVL